MTEVYHCGRGSPSGHYQKVYMVAEVDHCVRGSPFATEVHQSGRSIRNTRSTRARLSMRLKSRAGKSSLAVCQTDGKGEVIR